jgi:phage regulator Rha-like protein
LLLATTVINVKEPMATARTAEANRALTASANQTPFGDAQPSLPTMSSREIAELVDSRHDKVKQSIDRLVERGVIVQPPMGNEPEKDALQRTRDVMVYRLSKRDSYIVVAQLSPEFTARLVDRWQELEAAAAPPPPRAMTAGEMFLQNAQAMVAFERKQAEQDAAMLRLGAKVEKMAETASLVARPANSESITHIRPRMLKKYGLPARVVDEVMRQSPYAPRPAAMVKHSREEANGGSYAVYWVKDVSMVFDRFVAECKRVTLTKATHPYVPDRFTLAFTLPVAS